MCTHEFRVPVEDEFVQFFSGAPVERRRDDGYWCYEAKKRDGTLLRFSFNVVERSVQAQLSSVSGSATVTISLEMATQLTIYGGSLRCEFVCADCRGSLTIDGGEDYAIACGVLQTE